MFTAQVTLLMLGKGCLINKTKIYLEVQVSDLPSSA